MRKRDLGRAISPPAIAGHETVADLVERTFLAYNAARLREACRLFTQRMLSPDVTVGLSVTGVGIHGTPSDASIGYSASHGCIRMHIPEAAWLFEHVAVGTPVVIV